MLPIPIRPNQPARLFHPPRSRADGGNAGSDNRGGFQGNPPNLRGDRERLFIKIDTQGFEENVLKGLDPYLSRRGDWAIKMEFAPQWLESQGSDPAALLRDLVGRYEVAEFPERIVYGTPTFDALFAHPLRPEQTGPFLAYVRNLNSLDRGWVDLLVRPRPAA